MQVVSAAFTAEETDSVRKIAHNLQVSWKKETTIGNRTFTIGVSTIGGNDVIGLNPGALGGPGIYKYFDESEYVMGLSWEHPLSQPIGGINKSLAEASLDNTSNRFTPRYMSGVSELYTAILPRRPMIINAGFNFGGVNNVIPQFSGVLNKTPKINLAGREVKLEASDYVDFFQNKFVDNSVMQTAQRTDTLIENLLIDSGMSTAQYELDQGINIIPFALFESGAKFSDIIDRLVESENAQFYQDEMGKFHFENRQHWDNAPYTQVQKIIPTSQVINAEGPNTDHIINVVEVKTNPRVKANNVNIFTLSGTITLQRGDNDVFIDFSNPVLAANAPSITANSAADGSGSNLSGSISVRSISLFANSAKYVLTNNSVQVAYITVMTIVGRWAILRYTTPRYIRRQDDSSVTAYEEQPFRIENDYIQDDTWANSYAQLILEDFSSPENIQKLVIRAIPELQRGDLISYQGRSWRIYNIKAMLSPGVGFTQELTMIQRTLTTYFRIGISTIGGSDRISS